MAEEFINGLTEILTVGNSSMIDSTALGNLRFLMGLAMMGNLKREKCTASESLYTPRAINTLDGL